MHTRIKKIINKFISLPIEVKAAGIYFFTIILQKIFGFIANPVYTRLMTTEEFGETILFMTNSEMIGIVAMFCLSAGCMDVGFQDYKHDRNCFLYSLLILSTFITLICAAIYTFFYQEIYSLLEIDPFLSLVMFVNFIFSTAMVFWLRLERYEYHYKTPGVVASVCYTVSFIVAVIAVIYCENYRVYARIVGSLLPGIIIGAYLYYYIAKNAQFKIKFSYMKFAFLFNFPLIPHYLSVFFLGGSDRIMIANLCGTSEAGFYGLAYTISMVIMMVWTSISSALVPNLMEKYEKKDYDGVNRVVKPILVSLVLLCLAIMLLSPEILAIMGTSEYMAAVYAMPPIIASVFFQVLYFIFTGVLYFMKKPTVVMYASISSGLLNIALNYWLIPIYGFIVAGFTTLICYALQALIDYMMSKKYLGVHIYDYKFIGKMSILISTFSIISMYLYDIFVLRMIVFSGCCYYIVKHRDMITCMFRRKF